MNSTMVKINFMRSAVDIRTYSRRHKSFGFLLLRDEAKEILERDSHIARVGFSFGEFTHKEEQIGVRFSWLYGKGADRLEGYEEYLTLSDDAVEALRRFASGEQIETQVNFLSCDEPQFPHIVFESRKTLHNVAQNKVLRRKLGKFLASNFRWHNTEEIIVRDDFGNNFFFEEQNSSRPGLCGGIILHNPDGDLKRSYYSLHT